MTPFTLKHRLHPRRPGVALLIVVGLIGLFAVLCQALTMLVAIQHRQAFHHADQAQVHRLAEAGLLRAVTRITAQPDWQGEAWTPTLPTGETVVVQLKRVDQSGQTSIRSEAMLTTARGQVRKVNQSLALAAAPAPASTESSLP